MVKIVIENLGQKELLVNDLTKPVLYHLHANQVDWMHACGAKGRCTTCKMILVKGADHLTPPSPAEIRYSQQGALKPNERLACQSRLKGEITIRVSDEYKLPHVQYSF
jgi:Ferredoxin